MSAESSNSGTLQHAYVAAAVVHTDLQLSDSGNTPSYAMRKVRIKVVMTVTASYWTGERL